VYILCRYTSDIGRRYLLDSGLKTFQEIRRISIELVGHAFAQDFVRRVEVEDKGIENGVLGALAFFVVMGFLLKSSICSYRA